MMKEIALELLNIINDYGYEAYIVGGFVRDLLLGIESKDIDITTNATPMELKNIFPNIDIPSASYGAVTFYYKTFRFEITTYRKEADYIDNRHPNSIEYVNDLKTDLSRRDFKINTICLDKSGKVIDLLDGEKDLNNRIINTVDDSNRSFSNDALRILRAIRFSITLDLELSSDVVNAIEKNKELIRKLSYERKKYELDRIFASNRAKEGIVLLKKFNLIDILELTNINRVKDYSDLIGIWAMIDSRDYKFSSSERELIKKVNIVYEMDNLDSLVLYDNGVYVNVLAGINKGINKKLILETYENIPIKSRGDIVITAEEICQILNKKPGSFLKQIYRDLEVQILNKMLVNNSVELRKYIKNNF